MPDAATDVLARWLITYLAHSTVLLGFAWGATRLMGGRRPDLQESLWRAALLGGLLTATLQIAVAPRLPAARAAAVPAAAVATTNVAPAALAAPGQPLESAQQESTVPWSAALTLLWAGLAAVALARAAADARAARAVLHGRRPVSSGPLQALLRRLHPPATRPRVALSASPRLDVPVAVGIRRPEICVPDRVLEDLDAGEQECLLAHELAHHLRRDPMWLAGYGAVRALLVLQPLNRVAVRQLRELAEVACDDWAALRTGRARDLARCLATVAAWRLGLRPLLSPALHGAGRLEVRVQRLLAGTPDATRRRSGGWVTTGAIGLLAAVALVVPAIAPPPPADPPTAPAVAPAPAPGVAPAAPALPEEHGAPAAPAPAPAPRPHPPSAPAPAAAPAAPTAGSAFVIAAEDALALQREMERTARELGRRARELAQLERRENADPAEIAAAERRRDQAERRLEQLQERVERLARRMAERAAGIAERHRPDPALAAREAEVARVTARAASARERERLEAQIADLVARRSAAVAEGAARERAERERPDAEELARLEAELRARLAAARQETAELERLRRAARELAAGAQPSEEELESLRRELEEMLSQVRERLAAPLR